MQRFGLYNTYSLMYFRGGGGSRGWPPELKENIIGVLWRHNGMSNHRFLKNVHATSTFQKKFKCLLYQLTYCSTRLFSPHSFNSYYIKCYHHDRLNMQTVPVVYKPTSSRQIQFQVTYWARLCISTPLLIWAIVWIKTNCGNCWEDISDITRTITMLSL